MVGATSEASGAAGPVDEASGSSPEASNSEAEAGPEVDRVGRLTNAAVRHHDGNRRTEGEVKRSFCSFGVLAEEGRARKRLDQFGDDWERFCRKNQPKTSRPRP